MQKVPGAGRARADPDRAVGRDHQPELPRGRRRHGRALGHPAGRQRHAPAGHQPRGGARRDGRRRRGRGRAGGDRVHPARGLSRHAVHRRVGGQRRGGPPAGDASAGRRFAAADPRRPGHPGAVRPAPDRGGVPRAGTRPRRRDPARVRARVRDRPADRDGAARRPDRAPAVPQRPAQRELHRRWRPDPHHRLGVRGDGRPVLRSGQLQHQSRADARRGRDPAGCLRRGGAGGPAGTADADAGRVRLPRGDVGRPPAGRQHARCRLRRVCRSSIRPAAGERGRRRASSGHSARSAIPSDGPRRQSPARRRQQRIRPRPSSRRSRRTASSGTSGRCPDRT